MKKRLTIKIKKHPLNWWLMWLLVMMPFMLGVLNEILGLPYSVRYMMDLAWFVLLCLSLLSRRLSGRWTVSSLEGWIAVFLLITLLCYFVQFQSWLYYLWGVRNTFRFYIAFFVFAALLTPGDVEYYLNVFDKLFWLNAIVGLIQYFALGINQDKLGGLFSAQGGNSFINIFSLIVLAKSVVSYLEKREKFWLCASKCLAALIIAALAEIKFFFVEILVLVGLSVMFTNFTWRKLWIFAGVVAGVVVGAALLTVVFPNWGAWFSLQWFIDTATSDVGYTGSGDLNRLNAIPQINELWLTTWGGRLFGLGLGNCDTSSFAIVNTPFYEAYGDMHYTWLSYAMMYLECGWIGLIFYFGFFVLVYFNIRKIEKRSEGIAKTYCRMGKIMAIMCMIIAIYNSSLRTEAAYMVYFVLAIPFVFNKNRGSKGEENAERIYEKHLAERKGEFR